MPATPVNIEEILKVIFSRVQSRTKRDRCRQKMKIDLSNALIRSLDIADSCIHRLYRVCMVLCPGLDTLALYKVFTMYCDVYPALPRFPTVLIGDLINLGTSGVCLGRRLLSVESASCHLRHISSLEPIHFMLTRQTTVDAW